MTITFTVEDHNQEKGKDKIKGTAMSFDYSFHN